MALTEGGSSRQWRTTRARVLQRDGHLCQIGGPHCTVDATHVDHVIPRSHGGGDTESNLRAACAECNLSRGPGRSLAGKRTPTPLLSSPSPRDTLRTRHWEVPTR